MIHDCDLCGSSDFTPIDAARDYIGDQEPPVICMNCGFVYVRERRSSEEIARSWNEVWGEGYSSSWPMVKARLTYVAEWIDEQIGLEGKSVLDLGAGEGTFLEIVRGSGAYCVGVEPSKDNVAAIRSRDIACYHGTVETVEPGQHDIVTILWTLENCGDCIGFLKRAREFCRPDGHVVVATGSRILVPYKKPLSTYFSDRPQDLHCFRFSARSLAMTLTTAGLLPEYGNRHKDGDWLVSASKPFNETVVVRHDSPGEVLEFFNDWKAAFP